MTQSLRALVRFLAWELRRLVLPATLRRARKGETSKARKRRQSERFFERYCRGQGIDIGYGGDAVTETCDLWEAENGDACAMRGVPDASYDFVYSSHTLEHLSDPAAALQNWWRILRPGGYLILYVPDRDLYEKRRTLPSRWNRDHKFFFLPDQGDPPHTLGLRSLIASALPASELVLLRRCSEGHTISDPLVHSDGEYSIEAVIRKPLEGSRDVP